MENIRLNESIDKLFWNDWDPLGVNEFEEDRDWYYEYILKAIEMKNNNTSVEDIANYFHEIEIELMELFGNFENGKRVAEKIVSLP